MTPRSLHNAMAPRGGPDRMRSIGSVAGMLGRSTRGQPIDKTLSEIDSLMNERRGIVGGSSVGDADEAEAAAAAAAAAAAVAAARATRRVVQNKTYSAHELGVAALRLQPPGEPAIEAPPMAAGRRLKYKLEALRSDPELALLLRQRVHRHESASRVNAANRQGKNFVLENRRKAGLPPTAPAPVGQNRARPSRPSSAPAHLRHATAARAGSPPPPWPTRAWVPAGAWTATAPRRVTSRPTSARAKPPPAPARRARPTSAPPRSPSKAAAVDVAAAEEGVGAPDVRPGLA